MQKAQIFDLAICIAPIRMIYNTLYICTGQHTLSIDLKPHLTRSANKKAQHILCILLLGIRETRVVWILIRPGVSTRCSVNSTACKYSHLLIWPKKSSLKGKAMHNGASNEIKEIKVCKKCPKVKPYCEPIFDPIMFKPFLDGA